MERLIFADHSQNLYAYQGNKHPYDVPLTIGEIADKFNGEYSPREIVLEVFERLYAYEDTGYAPEEIKDLQELFCEIADIPPHRKLALKNCMQQNKRCNEYKELTAYRATKLTPEEISTLRSRLAEAERENKQLKQCELLLFLTVRMKVMETALRLGKSENEILAMTLESIESMKEMVDFERTAKIYEQAVAARGLDRR